jgi:uncharacterized protein (DUF608 family)
MLPKMFCKDHEEWRFVVAWTIVITIQLVVQVTYYMEETWGFSIDLMTLANRVHVYY